MLILDMAARLFSRSSKPFAAASYDVDRQIYRGVYNDLCAQKPGFTEICKVLVENHPDQKAYVCITPDKKSATAGRSCPPHLVIEGLATGIYQQLLAPVGIKPATVSFWDHVPAYRSHMLSHGPLWRFHALDWDGQQYNLARLPMAREARIGLLGMPMDETLTCGVPKLIEQLPLLAPTSTQELDLRPYTERPADGTPWRRATPPGLI